MKGSNVTLENRSLCYIVSTQTPQLGLYLAVMGKHKVANQEKMKDYLYVSILNYWNL